MRPTPGVLSTLHPNPSLRYPDVRWRLADEELLGVGNVECTMYYLPLLLRGEIVHVSA